MSTTLLDVLTRHHVDIRSWATIDIGMNVRARNA